MEETILRYKYVPFSDGSLKIISEGTMKFTSPTELNDPFDCAPEIYVAEYIKHISSWKDLLKKAGDHKGYSPAKRIVNKSKMLKHVENNVSSGDFIKSFSEKYGICSLTRDPLNLLMWAHYAKDHTGFVVEFSIPTKVEAYSENQAIHLDVRSSLRKPRAILYIQEIDARLHAALQSRPDVQRSRLSFVRPL